MLGASVLAVLGFWRLTHAIIEWAAAAAAPPPVTAVAAAAAGATATGECPYSCTLPKPGTICADAVG